MNSRNPRPIHGAHRSSAQRTLKICLCLIAALAIGLGCLSVYTVVTVKNQKDVTAEIQGLQDQLTKAEKARDEAVASLAERDKTIADLKKKLENQSQVIKPNVPPVNSKEKIVALTFDDGPGPYTNRLLDELKRRNIKATFFVLGNSVTQYPDTVKRIAQEGHEIGNHSNSHKNLKHMNAAQVQAEMNPCADKVERITGKRPTLIRCPFGNSNAHVKAYAKKENVPLIYWGVDTRDWEYKNKKDPVSLIMKEAFDGAHPIKNGSIVLMHDIHSTSVDAAIKMIDRLIADGYKLVTVSELLHARTDVVEAGETYTGAL